MTSPNFRGDRGPIRLVLYNRPIEVLVLLVVFSTFGLILVDVEAGNGVADERPSASEARAESVDVASA
jgi:hypothetical protein